MTSPRVSAAFPALHSPGTGAPRRHADPCTMVIFGAAGDLARRKLMPAVYRLAREGLLAPEFRVLGVARDAHDDAWFRDLMRTAVAGSDEAGGLDDAVWARLAERLSYVSGDFTAPEA